MTTVHCPCCGEESSVVYRCEHCGRDLADESNTVGQEEVRD